MKTMHRSHTTGRRVLAGAAALSAVAVAFAPRPAAAQEATTFHACYVPSSGTVYRIKAPGLRQECGTSVKDGKVEQHVEFSWAAGAQSVVAAAPGGGGGGGKTIDHGTLVGLEDDDHSQYLPASGARQGVNGFAVTGALGTPGPLPDVTTSTTPVPALIWHAGKGAFRAGGVWSDFTFGEWAWDEQYLGEFSIGLGAGAFASAQYSIAVGKDAAANGRWGTALGANAHANGDGSIALGGNASGMGAISLRGSATGDQSISIGGGASTNGHQGAIVISQQYIGQNVQARADNQFVARATSFWFGDNANVTATPFRLIETSTGAYLSSGGAWVSVSDSTKKTAFEDVVGEEVLAKISSLPIRTWSYRDEDAGVRHIGPTAQEFYSAFRLGDTETAIAGIDADGVSLAAIQALEKRTAEQAREIVALRQELGALRQELRDALSGAQQR